MSPQEIELVIRRLIAVGAPKVIWLEFNGGITHGCLAFEVTLTSTTLFFSLLLHEDFVIMLCFCSWLPFVCWDLPEYDIIEFFAGRGRIARLAHRAGFRAALYDKKYNKPPLKRSKHSGHKRRSYMDINSESGFLSLVWNKFSLFTVVSKCQFSGQATNLELAFPTA